MYNRSPADLQFVHQPKSLPNMAYDVQVLLPTLIGSILSCIASCLVLVSYVLYASQQRSFRHALVLNLALAGKTLLEIQKISPHIHCRVYQLSK
jgi:hypothetical protein